MVKKISNYQPTTNKLLLKFLLSVAKIMKESGIQMPAMDTLMSMDCVSSLNRQECKCGYITKVSATPFSIYVQATAGISETIDKVLVSTFLLSLGCSQSEGW